MGAAATSASVVVGLIVFGGGDPVGDAFDLQIDDSTITLLPATQQSDSSMVRLPSAGAYVSSIPGTAADPSVGITEAGGEGSAGAGGASPETPIVTTGPTSDANASTTQSSTSAPTSTTPPPSTAAPTPMTVAPPTAFNIGYFDIEGFDPRRGGQLVFDALRAKVTTPNGNGWRHEVKIEEGQRVALTAAYEDLQATVTAELSNGAKTIVAQHHASDTGTIAKLYISDTSESGFINSAANDGIFDVYVRLARADGDGEEKRALGTIRSGDSFTFRMLNERGVLTVSALGESFRLKVEDSSASYLKFGNYLQAQDPVSLDKVEDDDEFAGFYQDAGITTAVITFSNVNHVRQTS